MRHHKRRGSRRGGSGARSHQRARDGGADDKRANEIARGRVTDGGLPHSANELRRAAVDLKRRRRAHREPAPGRAGGLQIPVARAVGAAGGADADIDPRALPRGDSPANVISRFRSVCVPLIDFILSCF